VPYSGGGSPVGGVRDPSAVVVRGMTDRHRLVLSFEHKLDEPIRRAEDRQVQGSVSTARRMVEDILKQVKLDVDKVEAVRRPLNIAVREDRGRALLDWRAADCLEQRTVGPLAKPVRRP